MPDTRNLVDQLLSASPVKYCSAVKALPLFHRASWRIMRSPRPGGAKLLNCLVQGLGQKAECMELFVELNFIRLYAPTKIPLLDRRDGVVDMKLRK